MTKAIQLAEQTDTKEIQVQIARRIYGQEIARVEWIREWRPHAKRRSNSNCNSTL